MSPRSILVGAALAAACTSTSRSEVEIDVVEDPAPESLSAPSPTADELPFSPVWREGQTWTVEMTDRPSRLKGVRGSYNCDYTYSFTVSAIDDDGITQVIVREVNPQRLFPLSEEPYYKLSFDITKQAIRFESMPHMHKDEISPNALENWGSRLQCHEAWAWPRFPATPGTLQSFDGGAVKQTSVREGAKITITTTFRDLPRRDNHEIVTVTEWEEGRPWWNTSNSREFADGLRSDGVWHAGGKIQQWNAPVPQVPAPSPSPH